LRTAAVVGKLTAVSVAVTKGVRVSVESTYLPEQSDPNSRRFVFAYTVTIANQGHETVQLRTRHWIITDASGQVQEVRGEGVVGEKPTLEPNQSFQYTSGCILKTPWGTMNGTYQMYRNDGSSFDAEIAPFLLATPSAAPGGTPN
jgi:ApaG protein